MDGFRKKILEKNHLSIQYYLKSFVTSIDHHKAYKILNKNVNQLEEYFLKKLNVLVLTDTVFDLLAPIVSVKASSKRTFLNIKSNGYGLADAEILEQEASDFPDIVVVNFSFASFLKDPLYPHQFLDQLCSIYQNKSRILVQTVPSPIFEFQNKSIEDFNEKVKRKIHGVDIVDVEKLANQVGLRNWFDEAMYNTAKLPFSMKFDQEYSSLLVQEIEKIQGKNKKCIVLDLDNTLWGGVIGDDGIEGIKLGEGDPVGEAYRAFQKQILHLKDNGFILAVCSKNEKANAVQPFESHRGMKLKLDDISVFIANWEQKTTNIQEIALRLNIGLDSLVFIDDNPAERELVRQVLPMVEVLELPPDPALYARTLCQSGIFAETNPATDEDKQRTMLYKIKEQGVEESKLHADYDDFLKALQMKASIQRLQLQDLKRFTQLLNKTNQFNLRTIRYTEEQVQEMYQSDRYILVSSKLSDKFGDHGLVGAAIIKLANDRGSFIEAWVLSCRVFKRGLESEMMNFMIKELSKGKVHSVQGEYISTKKNTFVKDLYPRLGFSTYKDQNNLWSSEVSKYSPIITFIERTTYE